MHASEISEMCEMCILRNIYRNISNSKAKSHNLKISQVSSIDCDTYLQRCSVVYI